MRKFCCLLLSVALVGLVLAGAGCSSKSGDSTTAKTIKIGFFAPETGPEAADGTSAYNSAKLCVKQINDAGGINGAKVELVNYDDQLDTKQAVSIAQKLTTKDGVVAVVSGSYSDTTRAAAPIFQSAKIPLISGYAVHPAIPRTGDYIFQQSFSGVVEGAAAAQVASEKLHAKNVAILSINNDFGKTLVEGFQNRASKLGLKVQSPIWFNFGDSEFSPQLTKIKNSGADVLFVPAYAAEGSQIIRQIHDMGLKLQPLGTEGLDSTTQFLEVAGKYAENLIIVTNLNRSSDQDVVKKFISDYKAAYGHEPDMVGASTYDATYVVLKAIEQSGTDSAKIRDSIKSITNFEAVTGEISKYDSLRQVIKPVQVQQVKNGDFTYYWEVTDPAIITPPVS
jgi:branched-chain amino acid transport system substrate-binding protein